MRFCPSKLLGEAHCLYPQKTDTRNPLCEEVSGKRLPLVVTPRVNSLVSERPEEAAAKRALCEVTLLEIGGTV